MESEMEIKIKMYDLSFLGTVKIAYAYFTGIQKENLFRDYFVL